VGGKVGGGGARGNFFSWGAIGGAGKIKGGLKVFVGKGSWKGEVCVIGGICKDGKIISRTS